MGKPTRFTSLSLPVKTVTASYAIDRKEDAGKTIILSAVAGLTITLPNPSGTGDKYKFVVGADLTSNDYIIQVASSTDVISGSAIMMITATGVIAGFGTAADTDTITFNSGTTGGDLGTTVLITDRANTGFTCEVVAIGTATLATPFSAAV